MATRDTDELENEVPASGPSSDDDDANLLRKLKRWESQAKQHWSKWKEEARLSYDFVAGHQWSSDDKAALLDQMRQPVTFNRIAPMVDAVTGAEILNRQEVTYSPRKQGAVEVNEIITAADQWARDLADTEDEESDAFADVVITGLGYTETIMSYAEDVEGRIQDDRIDPLEMLSDPQAKKRCLADSRFFIRSRWRDKADLPEAWRKKLRDAPEAGAGVSDHVDEMGQGHSGPRDDYDRDDARQWSDYSKDKRMVWIRHFQWIEKETVYRISDEMTGEAITVDRKKLRAISQMFIANKLRPPEYVKVDRNIYRQAVLSGDSFLMQERIEAGGFTFKAITGKRDRNKNTFYGVVRAMLDPQQWGNKFFVQVLHILNTAAKGGLMYEAGSFINPRKALDDWSRPDAAIELQRGALTGQKAAVQERQPAVFPVGLDKMMEFALNNLPQTSGINLEMLGLVEREQAGVLEAHRKKAGYAILAVFFDSLRRYRKMKGRVRLYFIQHYISDGRLIKIKGKDSTMQYVPLVKQDDTATYDVIVDEAPMSPNQKEMTWQMMQAMIPMLMKVGGIPPEIWQIMLEYSPLPSSVSTRINSVISEAQQQPPPPDPDIEKAKIQAQGKQAELQQRAEADKQKAQIDLMKADAEAKLEREKMAAEIEVEKAKLAIEVEKTRHQLAADQQKHTMQMEHDRQKFALTQEQNRDALQFEDARHQRESAHERESMLREDARESKRIESEHKLKTDTAAAQKKGPRKISIKRDVKGRMSEISEQ
jgi:hypothetical protein